MKLSRDEKIERLENKSFLKAQGGKLFNDGLLTVCIEPTCKGKAYVTWAICGNKDTFNRKRGEFVALRRWADGTALPITIYADLKETAERIMDMI